MVNLVIERNEDVVLRKIGGVNLLIPSKKLKRYEGNKLFYISHVSAFLWDKMGENIKIEKLISLTQEQFEIKNISQIREDICEYIKYLNNLGFVKIKEEASK